MSSENPPPQPAPAPPVVQTPPSAAQQLINCPRCSALVTQGSLYCTNCGNPLPPSWPAFAPPTVPRPSRTGLIVGIVLIVLLVGGGVGYFVYWNNQQRQLVLQAAKTSEQTAANQSPSQIQGTCLTVATDSSPFVLHAVRRL